MGLADCTDPKKTRGSPIVEYFCVISKYSESEVHFFILFLSELRFSFYLSVEDLSTALFNYGLLVCDMFGIGFLVKFALLLSFCLEDEIFLSTFIS